MLQTYWLTSGLVSISTSNIGPAELKSLNQEKIATKALRPERGRHSVSERERSCLLKREHAGDVSHELAVLVGQLSPALAPEPC
jgi:hypothetical protein